MESHESPKWHFIRLLPVDEDSPCRGDRGYGTMQFRRQLLFPSEPDPQGSCLRNLPDLPSECLGGACQGVRAPHIYRPSGLHTLTLARTWPSASQQSCSLESFLPAGMASTVSAPGKQMLHFSCRPTSSSRSQVSLLPATALL